MQQVITKESNDDVHWSRYMVRCRWSQRHAFPHRHKEALKKLTSTSRGIFRASMFEDGLPNLPNSKDGILTQPPWSLNNNRNKIHPSGTQSDRWSTCLHCKPTFRT